MVSTFGLGDISLGTWILFIIIVLLVAMSFILMILPLMGINVRKSLKGLLQRANGEMEIKSNYHLIETNQTNPPIVEDEDTGREENVHIFAVDDRNRVTLFTKDDNEQTNIFTELEHREMLQLQDPLVGLKYIPGARFKIKRHSNDVKMKMEIESLKARNKLLEIEREDIVNKGAVDSLIAEGEKMKQTRLGAYGTAQPQNRFGPDKYGFGSKWRRSGNYGGGGDESADSEEG